MSSKKKIGILFLVVLLILPFTYGQEDYSLNYKAESDSVCPGSTVLFTIEVTNTGSVDSQYSVNMAGDASKWTTTVPTGFSLKPGQKKIVYNYITPKSTSLPGTYNLKVTVNTVTGMIKEVSHGIVIKECHKVNVAVSEKQEVCPGELAKYDFTITNNGEFLETFNLELGGSAVQYVKLSENSVVLDAGKSKTVFAYLENLEDIGSKEFTLTAKSKYASASNTAYVNVVPCFQYTIKTEKDYVSLCEHSAEKLAVTIANEGTKDNTYNLGVDGPLWASLEKNTVTLAAGQQESVNILFAPDYNVEGDFDVSFKATATKGEIEAIKLFKVNVRKCYKVSTAFSLESDKICAGLSNKYDVSVDNNGEVDNDFNIKLEGPGWVSIDKTFSSLDAGSKEAISVDVNPDANVKGNFNIKVTAESTDKVIKSEDTLNIDVISIEECYKPSVSVEKTSVKVGIEGSATVPIVIENKGSKQAGYTLAITGDGASFSQLNPSVLSLDPGKAETVYLYIAPSVDVKEGSYSVNVAARLEDTTIVDSKTVNIEVSGVAEEEVTTTLEVSTEVTTTLAGNVTGLEEVTGGAVKEGFFSKYGYYVIGIIVLIIILVIVVKYRDGIQKFFEEEEEIKEVKKPEHKIEKKEVKIEKKELPKIEEKEEKSKGLGYWIIGLIIVALILYFLWRYDVMPFLKTYKYYVLLGLIILIIILLIIKYRKALSEFFEEEEETKEEIKHETKIEKKVEKKEPEKKVEKKLEKKEPEDEYY